MISRLLNAASLVCGFAFAAADVVVLVHLGKGWPEVFPWVAIPVALVGGIGFSWLRYLAERLDGKLARGGVVQAPSRAYDPRDYQRPTRNRFDDDETFAEIVERFYKETA